jgi:hypothetical protein
MRILKEFSLSPGGRGARMRGPNIPLNILDRFNSFCTPILAYVATPVPDLNPREGIAPAGLFPRDFWQNS